MIRQYSWYVPLLDRILIYANPMAPLSGNFKGFSDWWTCELPIWMYWHCFQQVWFFHWKWWKACAFIVLPNIGQKWKKEKEMILRLCLFCVKIFSYCSGKENIFKCLVAFLKISKNNFNSLVAFLKMLWKAHYFYYLFHIFLSLKHAYVRAHTHTYI